MNDYRQSPVMIGDALGWIKVTTGAIVKWRKPDRRALADMVNLRKL
jgi:hypothetical protein